MRKFVFPAVLGMWLGLAAMPAGAATFTTIGSPLNTVLPPNFDLTPNVLGIDAGDAFSLQATSGSGLGISGPAELTFTFLGEDASFNNQFLFNAGAVNFTNAGTAAGTSQTVNFTGSGLLPFSFLSDGVTAIANGAGAMANASIGFLLLSGSDAVILFNDNGSRDADFDDMAVRVQISPVPLPGAAVLLVTGLAGLGWMRRRRRES
jgi:hypothetical protein